MFEPRNRRNRASQAFQRAGLVAAVLWCWTGYAAARDVPSASKAPAAPIKIAVFPFEFDDFSAASQEGSAPVETAYLAQSTQEAKQQLVKSGRYKVVDVAGADKGQALRNCNGCEAAIARKLGADQALLGEITKISMTEYVVNIQVSDARTGKVLSRFTTSLRIGADYSWSRGVRWLMQNRMLASK